MEPACEAKSFPPDHGDQQLLVKNKRKNKHLERFMLFTNRGHFFHKLALKIS